jgi:ubiquinone/menaquinone biosynthesis C-methylase UbiE
MIRDRLMRRFARLTTDVVVRRPRLWWLLRAPLRRSFDTVAGQWDQIRAANPQHLAAFEAALEAVEPAPGRALDLGTGTGAGAFAIAHRFPDAQVVGLDLAPAMIDEARRHLSPELAQRVRFEVGDAAKLDYGDGEFDLVALANMIPFFDDLARVVADEGWVVVSFSRGAETPIYVPTERLRRELAAREFDGFRELAVGEATALVARKARSRRYSGA